MGCSELQNISQNICSEFMSWSEANMLWSSHAKESFEKVREDEEYSKNKIIQKDCKEKISYTFVTESKNLSKPQNNQHKPYRGFEK